MFDSLSSFAASMSLDNMSLDKLQEEESVNASNTSNNSANLSEGSSTTNGINAESEMGKTSSANSSQTDILNELATARDIIQKLNEKVDQYRKNEIILKEKHSKDLDRSQTKIESLEKELTLARTENEMLKKQLSEKPSEGAIIQTPSKSKSSEDFFSEYMSESGAETSTSPVNATVSPRRSAPSSPHSSTLADVSPVVTPADHNSHSGSSGEAELIAEVKRLEDDLRSKQTALEELQAKHSATCEKFKETVKKLAEIKDSFKSKCKNYDEEIIQYRDSLNSKEFAYMSLQERFYHLEKQVGTKDMAAIQSKARITELEQVLEEKESRATENATLIADLKVKVSAVEKEDEELSQQCSDLKQQVSTLREQLESAHRLKIELEEELGQLKSEVRMGESNSSLHASQIESLNATITELRAQLNESAAVSVQFQEYKKRAQLALKQANSAVAESSSSLQSSFDATARKLQAEISSLSKQNSQLHAENVELAVSRNELVTQNRELTGKVKLLEERANSDHEKLIEMQLTVQGMENQRSMLAATESEELRDDAVASYHPSETAVPTTSDAPSSSFAIDDEEEEETSQAPPGPSIAPLGSGTVVGAAPAPVSLSDANGYIVPDKVESGPRTPAAAAQASGVDVGTPITPAGASAVSTPGSAGVVNPSQLYVVYQLQQQIQSLRNDYISRGLQCDDLQRTIKELEHDKVQLETKNAELSAFLARIKQQLEHDKNTESSNNIINLEYLKNCIHRFMSTTELSEKIRLVPVIATILQFTEKEKDLALTVVKQSELPPLPKGGKDPEESVAALFSSMFGHS